MEELFADIPAAVRLQRELDLPEGFSEQDVYEHLASLAGRNRGSVVAAGAGVGVVGRLRDWSLVRRTKAAMRNASPLPVYSINAPSFVTGVDFSDQLNYWDAGYDAVMITDTAFYRNRNYHTAQDTEEKLDYQRLAMVVEGVYAAVLDLSRE